MEQLDLTTPLPPAGTTVLNYRIIELVMNWPNAHVAVTLSDQVGGTITCTYDGAEAASLMLTLNRANLTNNSLHKRAINKLVSDGKLPAGTITGSP